MNTISMLICIICFIALLIIGYLNYNKKHNSLIKLNENELKYCEYDCIALYDLIKGE